MKNLFKRSKPTEVEQVRNTIKAKVDQFKSNALKIQSTCHPIQDVKSGKWNVVKTEY